MMDYKIVGVIPARYKSTRFPGKPLVKLLGKPMILWVAELTSIALGKENTYIATEDERIKNVVEEAGFNVVMTSDKHQTGTARLVEVARIIDADIYVNIQGDEPTVAPDVIRKVVKTKLENPSFIINAMAILNNSEDPHNINIPKVIVNEKDTMVYMSRLAIPGFKSNENKPDNYYKQVCIYAFSKDQLLKYGDFGRKSTLEMSEDIEILRYLDLDISVKMIKVNGNSYAIDVKEDIDLVENRLKEIHKMK